MLFLSLAIIFNKIYLLQSPILFIFSCNLNDHYILLFTNKLSIKYLNDVNTNFALPQRHSQINCNDLIENSSG